MNINKEMNAWLSLWVIPLIGEMSAKQTKGCPFPEEKLAKSKILTERAFTLHNSFPRNSLPS